MNLVRSKDLCRLSTISPNGWPHSVPVSYVYQNGAFYIPSGPNTKKIGNLQKNSKATLVIDDESTEHGLMIECQSKILRGAEAERFRNYMREVKKWANDEMTVVLELYPPRKVSWFLK